MTANILLYINQLNQRVMSVLNLQILGNIGQDATVNEVNGRFCINFSIAHNRKWTDADGVERKSTTWVNCGFWKDKREKTEVAKYLKAGTIVLVDGTPEVRQYKNKDGQMISSLQCNVTNLNLAGTAQPKTDGGHAAEVLEPADRELPGAGSSTDGGDDLPF